MREVFGKEFWLFGDNGLENSSTRTLHPQQKRQQRDSKSAFIQSNFFQYSQLMDLVIDDYFYKKPK
ncbi:hypothetical protein DEO72_LG4g1097 [Vigna unguiculata]|uniref:Uncharacterized protein n=1 Tax=Vigna unguiculata TaxID=3917 RepID=A0A4D6LNU9_VIGUN|nr:hypothetical protein DEO72_LG4g1097 [Vigna unguiculata]